MKMSIRETVAQRLARLLLKEKFDQVMYGGLHFEGHIRGRVPPFESEADFIHWWLPEVQVINGQIKIIREARMTPREKDRYTVVEGTNTLMMLGRVEILNYLGSAIGNGVGFAQYFAVGHGPVGSINAADSHLLSEMFRAIPSTSVITGDSIEIDTFFSASQGNGPPYEDCGLFGNGATSTPGSGTLFTHSFYSYTKTSANPLINSYTVTLGST